MTKDAENHVDGFKQRQKEGKSEKKEKKKEKENQFCVILKLKKRNDFITSSCCYEVSKKMM